MTANNYTTNNVVFFIFGSDLKIVYYNPLSTKFWTKEAKIFCVTAYLVTKIIQNCPKIDATHYIPMINY